MLTTPMPKAMVADHGDTPSVRGGETLLPFDPAPRPDATLVFIGRVRSGWRPGNCPYDMTEARARGGRAAAEIDPAFRAGVAGLAPGDGGIVMTQLDAAPRDLIALAPRHRDRPAGTFALRSRARPNPLGVAVTRVASLDQDRGLEGIKAIDARDGTPLVDLKPRIAAVDIPPGPAGGLASLRSSG
jgi:tRNA (Thr-GGU) A37 N-methylase